jgi:hypothetical protein
MIGAAPAGERVPGAEPSVLYSSAMHPTGTIIIS